MKVNMVKLGKIIQKATFNYRLDGAKLHFDNNKITSSMISADNAYVSLIKTQNDVITEMRPDTGFELNFDLRQKGFSWRDFNKFGTDEYVAELTEEHFVIKNGDFEAYFDITSDLNHIFLKDSLLEFNVTNEAIIEIDNQLVKTVLTLCKSAPKFEDKSIHFVAINGLPGLQLSVNYELVSEGNPPLYSLDASSSCVSLDGSVSGDNIRDFTMSFDYRDIRSVFKIIETNIEKRYKIHFEYDGNILAGLATIFSSDETEKYIIYSNRYSYTGDVKKLGEQQHYQEPELPNYWNYVKSVEKLKTNGYKWNSLTEEMLTELWVAREILALSKSEAAKIMHGTKVPWMSWDLYCKEIGSSRQVVNRWLKRAFGSRSPENGTISSISESSVPEPSKTDKFYTSAKKVVGEDEAKLIKAHKGREAKENIKKAINDLESGKIDEAIVRVNNNYTYRDWFKPLFNGLICFTNDPKAGCFVYLGERHDEFVSEFSKHGVVMAKVEEIQSVNQDQGEQQDQEDQEGSSELELETLSESA